MVVPKCFPKCSSVPWEIAGSDWVFNLKEDPQTDQKGSVTWEIVSSDLGVFPQRFVKNFDYRLYSKIELEFNCCDGKLTIDPTSQSLDVDGGYEALGVIYGSINSDKFTYERIDKSSMRFRYRVFGSPNPIAEPVFQAVKPRRARNIWHYVGVTISCKGDAGFHKAKFEDVSGFPSHRLWINGRRDARTS